MIQTHDMPVLLFPRQNFIIFQRSTWTLFLTAFLSFEEVCCKFFAFPQVGKEIQPIPGFNQRGKI